MRPNNKPTSKLLQVESKQEMRIISFNVNGIRSMCSKIKNGEKTGTEKENVITTLIKEQQPDILCFQEIKTSSKADLDCLKPYFQHIFTNHAQKKGYSGTALLSKERPEWISYDFAHFPEEVIGEYESKDFENEGRLITAKFSTIVVVTCYTPNSKPELARLDERMEWEELMRNYLKALETETGLPVILNGDLNVAHNEIDIHNPKGKDKTAGYSKEERTEFQKLLDEGFTDSFRYMNPTEKKYTYWSNFANSRDKNLGWRIDYFVVSKGIQDKIKHADCLTEYHGSDHCPILLDIDV